MRTQDDAIGSLATAIAPSALSASSSSSAAPSPLLAARQALPGAAQPRARRATAARAPAVRDEFDEEVAEVTPVRFERSALLDASGSQNEPLVLRLARLRIASPATSAPVVNIKLVMGKSRVQLQMVRSLNDLLQQHFTRLSTANLQTLLSALDHLCAFTTDVLHSHPPTARTVILQRASATDEADRLLRVLLRVEIDASLGMLSTLFRLYAEGDRLDRVEYARNSLLDRLCELFAQFASLGAYPYSAAPTSSSHSTLPSAVGAAVTPRSTEAVHLRKTGSIGGAVVAPSSTSTASVSTTAANAPAASATPSAIPSATPSTSASASAPIATSTPQQQQAQQQQQQQQQLQQQPPHSVMSATSSSSSSSAAELTERQQQDISAKSGVVVFCLRAVHDRFSDEQLREHLPRLYPQFVALILVPHSDVRAALQPLFVRAAVLGKLLLEPRRH